MKDNSNYEIIENDAELEKLCTDSVELINYARGIFSRQDRNDLHMMKIIFMWI